MKNHLREKQSITLFRMMGPVSKEEGEKSEREAAR